MTAGGGRVTRGKGSENCREKESLREWHRDGLTRLGAPGSDGTKGKQKVRPGRRAPSPARVTRGGLRLSPRALPAAASSASERWGGGAGLAPASPSAACLRARARRATGACTPGGPPPLPGPALPPSHPPTLPRPARPALASQSSGSLPPRARSGRRCAPRPPAALPEPAAAGGGGGGAAGARRGGGGGGKMADFLPSRSVLSVCFPGCVLTNGEAEQQRKSKEIDKCLSREKTYVKRLVKILLLGAGESGKSTFLKQMRIIHGQDFDQRAREEFRPTIYSNVIKGAGARRGSGTRGPLGSRAGHRPHPPVPSLRTLDRTRSDGRARERASERVGAPRAPSRAPLCPGPSDPGRPAVPPCYPSEGHGRPRTPRLASPPPRGKCGEQGDSGQQGDWCPPSTPDKPTPSAAPGPTLSTPPSSPRHGWVGG